MCIATNKKERPNGRPSLLFVLHLGKLPLAPIEALAVFTALVQGVICAGLAVYGDQMVKQAGKPE